MNEVEEKKTADVTLWCGVYGGEDTFSVEVPDGATVEALKKTIAGVVSEATQRAVPPQSVVLYLAKKNGAWLKDDSGLDAILQGDVDRECKKMRASWKVSKYLDENFESGDGEIHVLVELRTQAAAPSSVTPPLPTNTQHRHPERLKRWAAINAMIRQKNRDANQATTNEDTKNTNKKRKNHGVDKSVGYSSLSWEDIKPIYSFDSYDLRPRDIPDAEIELLLARIRDLRTLYGQVSDGKEAKRLFFIAPILETVSRLLGDVRILVEEDVVGKNVLVKGRFEFVLQRGTKRIAIVEAKREEMQQGLVQNVAGLEALADVEDLAVAYGIVTNYLEWKFLISEDVKVRQQECTLPLTDTIPTFEGLKEIAGKIYTMLSNEQ